MLTRWSITAAQAHYSRCTDRVTTICLLGLIHDFNINIKYAIKRLTHVI